MAKQKGQAVEPAKEAKQGDSSKPDVTQVPVESPYIVYRSREGLKLIKSFQDDSVCKNEIILAKTEDKNNRVESVCCSEDGQFVAWCDNNVVKCVRFDTREVVFEQANVHKSNSICLSPRATKLITYSTMSGGDNLHFWDVATQEHLASMPFRKASQWKPVFSMNEDICLLHVKSELLLFVGGKFDKPKKISHIKIDDFSLSSAAFSESTYQHVYDKRIKNKTHYVSVYTAGTKGQPSIVKIYKYPNMTDCITNKSFFKADRVKFSWSPSGNSLLLTCIADFDKSGKSYYGEQSLNFLSVKGDSYFVKLPKEGTISHIEWYPSCDQDMFVCVYGLVPAKVSLFNNKCEVIFDFTGDQGSFNAATFNPFGNLLAIYGFGNLAGQLCIWNFEKKKLISTQKVPETTGLEWCADGLHLVTCTTTPRLRVANGFRIWHYSGSLIYEKISGNDQTVELYDVIWQPKPGSYRRPKCDAKPSRLPNLLNESKLSKFQGSAGKYIPPSERNRGNSGPSFMDSAIGKSGNREIVGLESLNISGKKKQINRPSKSGNNSNGNKTSQPINR